MTGIAIKISSAMLKLSATSDAHPTTLHVCSYFNKSDILAAVDAIPYPASSTKTSLGLNRVRVNSFTEASGMRPAAMGINRVLLVLTDGQATSGYQVSGRQRSPMPIQW